MKLVERTDPDGTKHLEWIRDVDPEDIHGIPHDPPDLSGLGLPQRSQRQLNNILIGKRLIVWHKHDQLKQELTDVLKKIRRPDLLPALLELYEDRQVMDGYEVQFNLNHALKATTLNPDQRACIKRLYKQANITTLEQVENAPAIFRGHICGIDIYQLVQHILSRSQ